MKKFLFALALTLSLTAVVAETAAQEIVAVVSASSPVQALNAQQVSEIFLGKAVRFPDGTEAVPIDQLEDSPVRERFYSQFAGKSPSQVKAIWSKIIFTGRGQPPKQAANSTEAKRLVVDNPRGIAYIEHSLIDSSVRVIATVTPR